MKELLEKEQIISVVPQDFRNAFKAKVTEISETHFELESKNNPKGIHLNNLIEFYSQTKNGVLYFKSDVVEIKENILKILNPIKHRFLQRRQFTRISLSKTLTLKNNQNEIKVLMIDLSAGGMKLTSKNSINIDSTYELEIPISETQEQSIKTLLQPIRVEKDDAGDYTVSGRFQNLSNVDKMTLVQFCMKKKLENTNK